jgi:hypothetical protein
MMESKTPGTDPKTDADPRRLAACVAACRGISTEALEAGFILRLIAACVHLKEPRIQEILQSLGAIRPQSGSRSQRSHDL